MLPRRAFYKLMKDEFRNGSKNRSKSTVVSQKIQTNQKNESWENALPFNMIPGPPALPIVGTKYSNLPLPVIGGFSLYKLDYFIIKIFKDFGPIVRFEKFYGEDDIILVHDANDIEWMYRNEGIAPDRISHSTLEYYKTVTKKDFFENIGGIVAVDPEKWSFFRPKVNIDMLKPKAIQSYLKPIEKVAKKLVNRIDLITDKQNEVPKDFQKEIAKWALESLCTFALDVEMGCLDPVPNQEVQEFIEAACHFDVTMLEMEFSVPLWKYFYTPHWIQFEKALNTILSTVTKHVNIAINRGIKGKNPENLSVLEKLLLKNAENPKVALIAAFDLYLAGVETMKASGLSALYFLSKNPRVQEKLYKEIKQIAPSYETPLTNADIENMHYLKAFIKEVLRVAPPIPTMTRRLIEDSVIQGYQVPKGTFIGCHILLPQNSEKYFKNAHQFEPERWLRTNANEDIEKRHPFSNIPFSFGKRACIGRRFANLQLYTLICKMLQKYKIEYKYQDLEYYSSPFYCLNGPLKFMFTKRL